MKKHHVDLQTNWSPLSCQWAMPIAINLNLTYEILNIRTWSQLPSGPAVGMLAPVGLELFLESLLR
jgi:hypothetical protein